MGADEGAEGAADEGAISTCIKATVARTLRAGPPLALFLNDVRFCS